MYREHVYVYMQRADRQNIIHITVIQHETRKHKNHVQDKRTLL